MEVKDLFINLVGEIFPQHICVSNHHTVCFKYLKVLLANYTSIKLGGNVTHEKKNHIEYNGQKN